MPLPVSIDNIPSDDHKVIGDLIITNRAMYFFPRTDREVKSKLSSAESWLSLVILIVEQAVSAVGNWLGISLVGASYVVRYQLRKTSNNPKVRKDGIWKDGDSSSILQSKLDAEIRRAKEHTRPIITFSSSLPLPHRFLKDEVTNVRISSLGRLQFESRYDKHEFRIGPRRKKLLRNALWEAGFLR